MPAVKPKKAGRPALPRDRALSEYIGVRFTPSEAREIRRIARERGTSPAQVIRDMLPARHS